MLWYLKLLLLFLQLFCVQIKSAPVDGTCPAGSAHLCKVRPNLGQLLLFTLTAACSSSASWDEITLLHWQHMTQNGEERERWHWSESKRQPTVNSERFFDPCALKDILSVVQVTFYLLAVFVLQCIFANLIKRLLYLRKNTNTSVNLTLNIPPT